MDDRVSSRRRLGHGALDRMEVRHRFPTLLNSLAPPAAGCSGRRIGWNHGIVAEEFASLPCGAQVVSFLFVIIIFVGPVERIGNLLMMVP